MGQNSITGIKADKYGRYMAKVVAHFLGTQVLSPKSNEIDLLGERLVVKSAHWNGPAIGLSLAMLKRVDGVIAALEDRNGDYSLYRLNPNWYQGNMRPSRSKSPSAGKIKMVPCKAIRKSGRFLKKMKVNK